MQLAKLCPHLGEHAGDVVIFGHIARHDQRVGAERAGQFLDVVFQAFALIGEGEPGTGLMPGLRDGPGDRAFVGDSEHDSKFSSE